MTIDIIGSSLVDAIFNLSGSFFDKKYKEIVLPFGSKVVADDYELTFGGGGANVAVGLSKLGLRTKLFTALGNDILAREIESNLERNLVTIRPDRLIDKSAISAIIRVGVDRTIITGKNHFDYPIGKLNGLGSFVHLSPLPAASEIYEYLYEKDSIEFLSVNLSRDAVRNINSNIKRLIRSVDVLFINVEEARLLTKSSKLVSLVGLIKRLADIGAKVICLTCAENGAYVADGQSIYYARALKDRSKRVDSTGAGDAFSSGFLAGFLHNPDDHQKIKIHRALSWAIADSASVVTTVGAEVGLLSETAIRKTAKEVNIKIIQ